MMNSLGLWEIQLIGNLSTKKYYDKRSTQRFEVPSFFFTNNIGASQGDLLGFIYPLFRRSFNFFFNFSYTTKENRQVDLEMGFTFDIKLIAWSTSLVGGKLGNSTRKTLKYFSKSFPTIPSNHFHSQAHLLAHANLWKQFCILLYPFLKLFGRK